MVNLSGWLCEVGERLRWLVAISIKFYVMNSLQVLSLS